MNITANSCLFEELEPPIDSNYSEKKPISSILGEQAPTQGKIEFCYQIAKRTLIVLLEHRYSEFDAKTTSNCCHGMSLLVRELIYPSKQEDLQGLLEAITRRIDTEQTDPNLILPKALIDLCQLYILTYIRTICPEKGPRTLVSKLEQISPLGRSVRDNLVKTLQKNYSNLVAFRYEYYLNKAAGIVETCGVPIELWGKYVSSAYLRKSSNNTYFAPCIYSMQITLAHLILSKAKIAVVNDIYDSMDVLSERYVKILEGNGTNGFDLVHVDSTQDLESISDEPVIVFGGCAYNDNPTQIRLQMDQWMNRFPNLVLACDTSYPQFPKACDDANFQNHAIVPEDTRLQNIIDRYSKLDGVSANNPTFYCLKHIYPISLKQILTNNFLSHKIPTTLLKSEPVLSK